MDAIKNFTLLAFYLVMISKLIESFQTATEENDFVQSILEQTTNKSPHSNMLNKTVYLYLDLYQLLGIDEKEGTVNLKLWIYITYYLPHLAWDPSVIGIYTITLPPRSVWTPDIVFFDATEMIYDTFHDQIILYNGLVVTKTSNINLKTVCSINVRHFPFDTQECRLLAGHWVNTESSYKIGVDLTFSEPDKLDLLMLTQSGQWHLREPVTYSIIRRRFKDLPEYFTYNNIEYVFTFDRIPTFYVSVILIPAILLGATSVLSLVLPVEAGEKVSLGVTILLAQIVELLVLSEILPPSRDNDFPIVGQFVIFLIVLVTLSVVVCVLVSTIYYIPPCKCLPLFIVRVLTSKLMDILFLERLILDERCNPFNKPDVSANQKLDQKPESAGEPESSNGAWKNSRALGEDVSRVCDIATQGEINIAINTRGWKLFAALIDRLFCVCYTLAQFIGMLYYYSMAKSD